jgi:hypothetical protein
MRSPHPKTGLFIAVLTLVALHTAPIHAKTRVFLLGGQSNMIGQGANSELTAPYDTPQTDVNFWRGGTWVPVRPGFGNSANSFGPEVSFGIAIKDAYPADDLYLIKYAVGGTALYNDWSPVAPGGPQYNGFTNTAAAALANLDAASIDYEIAGMLWMQGESDSLENRGQFYETNLRNFITAMRDDYGDPDLPFIVARIQSYWGTQAQLDLVRAAEQAVAETTHNVEWFDTDPYPVVSPSNPGHYGTQGILSMGIDFAAGYQSTVPEPTSAFLAVMGAFGLLATRRRSPHQPA